MESANWIFPDPVTNVVQILVRIMAHAQMTSLTTAVCVNLGIVVSIVMKTSMSAHPIPACRN